MTSSPPKKKDITTLKYRPKHRLDEFLIDVETFNKCITKFKLIVEHTDTNEKMVLEFDVDKNNTIFIYSENSVFNEYMMDHLHANSISEHIKSIVVKPKVDPVSIEVFNLEYLLKTCTVKRHDISVPFKTDYNHAYEKDTYVIDKFHDGFVDMSLFKANFNFYKLYLADKRNNDIIHELEVIHTGYSRANSRIKVIIRTLNKNIAKFLFDYIKRKLPPNIKVEYSFSDEETAKILLAKES